MTSETPGEHAQEARTSRAREWMAALLAALVAAAAVGTADLLQPAGRADAGAMASRPLLREFGSAVEGRGRLGDHHSELRLTGLWPDAVAEVELDLTAKVERGIRAWIRGRMVAEALIGPEPSTATIRFEAPVDDEGTLSVRVTGRRREGTAYRLLDVRVRQQGPRLRLAQGTMYALLGAWTFLLARRRWALPRALAFAIGLAMMTAATVYAARLQALAILPWLAGGLGFVWASLVLAAVGEAVLDLPRAAGRWVAAALLLRIGLAIAPGFGSVDAHWHTHQLWGFAAGGLVTSGAPGVEVSPYPPALYAILLPFVDLARDDRLVRLAMALMEGFAPLLVLGIVRAAGAREAAVSAAVAMAVMPEGILVLAKGIAANILGSFATLLFLLATFRRVHPAATAFLLALVFLSHAAVAVTVGLLLAAWWALELREGGVDRREALRRSAWTAGAALLAWLAYYREVPVVLQEFGPGLDDSGVLGMRWYRAGKLAQDLVL